MSSHIVACFDNATDARAVQEELITAGVPREGIHLAAEQGQQQQRQSGASEGGFWESMKDAFGFADDDDRATYTEATRRGSIIVSADVPDTAIDQAVAIMRNHNAVDLDRRASEWRQQGWAGIPSASRGTGAAGRAATGRETRRQEGEEVVPVVEEELRVGKRAVQQGGVRVYSHVTERPVEEQVELRRERVEVERRPVDRPVSKADQAFQERAIEATETAEEAVVDKQARVVEEVAVRKDVEQRAETVRDTVRRTDVEVERLPGQDAGATMRSGDDATAGRTAGAARGGSAEGRSGGEDVDAFVVFLRGDNRFQGRDWDASEADIRSTYEQRYPGRQWDQVRDRIRQAMSSRGGR